MHSPLRFVRRRFRPRLRDRGRFPYYAGGVPMDEFEFVNKLNIQRFQNLLKSALSDSERQIIQKLLIEEKAKPGLSGTKSKSE